MESEIWRPVKGYEGFYEVSNCGKVRSVSHEVKSRYKTRITTGKLLKQIEDKDGYYKVSLSKNNIRRSKFVHRLVAEAFLENPNMFPVINHKDENKKNNKVENLEFCTVAYNTAYNNSLLKRAKKRSKPIKAVKGNEVLFFDSIAEAGKILGVKHGNISGCLHKRYGRKTLKGYSFEFCK